jgi:hypothetical protein
MMWKLKWTKKKTMDLMVKTFGSNELYEALCQLTGAVRRDAPGKKRDGATRTGIEAYALDIFLLLQELGDTDAMPEIVVPCTELSRCPVDTGRDDDPTILTRMDRLEQAVRQVLDKVPAAAAPAADAVGANGTVPRAGPGFGPALARGRSISQGRQRAVSVAGRREQVAQVATTEPGEVQVQQPWADVAAAGAAAGGVKRGRAGHRDGDGFQIPGRPARKSVPKGTSTVDLRQYGALCAPIERYVGKTDPRLTPEIVTEVLKRSAAAVPGGENLEIIDVVQVNGHLEHVRTKAWKVTVPYSSRAIMDNPATYPEGWEHRAYFAPRGERSGEGGKRPRQGEPQGGAIVTELLQQAERDKVASQQAEEDRFQVRVLAGVEARMAEERAKQPEAAGPVGPVV